MQYRAFNDLKSLHHANATSPQARRDVCCIAFHSAFIAVFSLARSAFCQAPKKGVSKDEKRQRLLAIFHDTRDVFVLNPKGGSKNIQKLAAAKGIISNAVPDVLKELIGDDLVNEGKVGISTFYWAFPGEVRAKKLAEIRKIQTSVDSQRGVHQDLQRRWEQAMREAATDETEAAELAEALASMTEMRDRLKQTKLEVERMRKAGAADLAARRKDIPVLREAANRWTDNLFVIKKHMVDKFNMDPKQVDKEFDLGEIDYVD
ncbi:hypothetical protein AB1Y20_018067 [Prymnesium parvum]|uniref:Meiotic nuclear division protein 1 homolog n=1 Tax=Prymnesium parvum TaxID=97485 RepID=A0AB34JM24_PRYPA